MLTIQFRLLGNGQWPNISITLPSATLSILTEGFVVGEVDIIASVYDNEHSRLSHYSKYVRNDHGQTCGLTHLQIAYSTQTRA